MNKLFQWNWGKGIVLVYACFVVGMLYLVFQSKQQKIDLVVDDYYQQELKFQQQIDASNRAVKAGVKARLVTHSGQQFLYLEGIPSNVNTKALPPFLGFASTVVEACKSPKLQLILGFAGS